MTISFNSIAANIRTPGAFVEYDNSRAVQGSPPIPRVAVIIGQRLAAGSIAADTPTLVSSADAGEVYFGHGSALAQMIEYFKAANPYTELWAIAMDDEGAGVAATGTFPFVGTATAAGTVVVYIGGERIEAAVAVGDTATEVGDAVAAAITAHLQTSNLPVSAAAVTGTVTITCLHKGTLGNSIDLSLNLNQGELLPAGITCTPVAMASGATDPSVAGPIAAFADSWYTHIISQLSDDTNVSLLEAQAATQWGPMDQRDTQIFIAGEGNQGTLSALGNARNSRFTVLMGAGLSTSVPWVWASVTGAVDAGEPDPARPRQTLLLPGLVAPVPADRFTLAERGILLTDGVSTYTVGQDGKVYIERLITTYQTNALGVSDPSYLDRTTMDTLAYLRYTLRARIALRFPRHKLADDGTNFSPGQAVATPATIKSEIFALFYQWEAAGLVEGWEQFKKDIIVERNTNDPNRVDVQLSPDLMNQFRVFAGQIQFLL